jgi:hypothetical protein
MNGKEDEMLKQVEPYESNISLTKTSHFKEQIRSFSKKKGSRLILLDLCGRQFTGNKTKCPKFLFNRHQLL